MTQAIADEISIQTMSDKGQITVSAEARHRLSLEPGDELTEFVLDGCLVFVPNDAMIGQTIERLKRSLEEHGLSSEDLTADLDEIRAEVFAEYYPDLAK
jgi:bifunctional DNA-binding transcriptional regulator/antitoxin component of YhaV-PrlF toxin-antitoxin module